MKVESGAVYLLLGPEEGERERFLKDLGARLRKVCGTDPQLERVYPFGVDFGELVASLRNCDLFNPCRLVLLHQIETLGKQEIQLLAGYCARPMPGTILALISEEISRELEDRFRSLASGPDFIKKFWELFESQKAGWVVNALKKQEVRIDAEAVQFLLDMVENNTKQLQETCNQLVLFFGPGAKLELQDIEKLLYHSKEENVFTLFERFARRDYPSAAEVLQKVLASRETEPVQLLSALVGQLRRLIAFKDLLEAGYPTVEAFARAGLKSKRQQKIYQEASRRFKAAELKQILLLSAHFDLRLRAVKSTLHTLLMHLYLYYALVRGGLGAWQEAGRSVS